MALKKSVLGLRVLVLICGVSCLAAGCGNSTGFEEVSSTESLYSKDTASLAEDATSEVLDQESCQTDQPDFAAVKEQLVAKLTDLIAKLEAVDTAGFDEERLAKHQAFLAKVQEDLETVSAATELTDELKDIIHHVWHPEFHRRPGHFGPPMGADCHADVRHHSRDRQCASLDELLSRSDLPDALRTALEDRQAEVCQTDASDGGGSVGSDTGRI